MLTKNFVQKWGFTCLHHFLPIPEMLAVMLESIFKLLIEYTNLMANKLHGLKINVILVDVTHPGNEDNCPCVY